MHDDDDENWLEHDSGPYCRHWGDPISCEDLCRCGHTCREHFSTDGCRECDCEEFEDADE